MFFAKGVKTTNKKGGAKNNSKDSDAGSKVADNAATVETTVQQEREPESVTEYV